MDRRNLTRLMKGVWERTYNVTVTLSSKEITESWWLDKGGEDRPIGPSEFARDLRTGVVFYEEWKRNSVFHREDGPAYIERDRATGEILKAEFYRNGLRIAPPEQANRPSKSRPKGSASKPKPR